MLPKVKKPYVIYLAEVIYKNIADIKKNKNSNHKYAQRSFFRY